MTFDTSLGPGLLLVMSSDGKRILSATYSSDQVAGVLVLVIVSCFSLIAVVGLLVLMAVSAWSNRASETKNYFFRTNIALYFICLLIADLIQACGSIMNARWVELGGVHAGGFCTGQAILKHLSDVSPALWSFVISLQTFCLLFYQLHSPRWMGWAVVGLAHGLVIMLTFLGPAIYGTGMNGDFYGISGYWCWITPEYDLPRATMGYMILFLSAFLSLILDVLIFFRLRGNIIITGWHLRFRMLEKEESAWGERGNPTTGTLAIAKQMIIYPIAFTFLFLPIAVVRMCEWAGHPVSFAVTIFCDSIFLMSGVVNVALFCTIRRVLPIKEVAIGLLTGRIIRQKAKPQAEATWFIGSVEDGEKLKPVEIVPAATTDAFLLRQPKFEIIVPPQAVLPNHVVPQVAERTTRQVPVTKTEVTIKTEVIAHADSPPKITPPPRPLPRKPPVHDDDGGGRDPSSFSHGSLIRKLPPVPRSGTLPSIVENQESVPASAPDNQYSISRSAPSHGHSLFLSSITSPVDPNRVEPDIEDVFGDSLKDSDSSSKE